MAGSHQRRQLAHESKMPRCKLVREVLGGSQKRGQHGSSSLWKRGFDRKTSPAVLGPGQRDFFERRQGSVVVPAPEGKGRLKARLRIRIAAELGEALLDGARDGHPALREARAVFPA